MKKLTCWVVDGILLSCCEWTYREFQPGGAGSVMLAPDASSYDQPRIEYSEMQLIHIAGIPGLNPRLCFFTGPKCLRKLCFEHCKVKIHHQMNQNLSQWSISWITCHLSAFSLQCRSQMRRTGMVQCGRLEKSRG